MDHYAELERAYEQHIEDAHDGIGVFDNSCDVCEAWDAYDDDKVAELLVLIGF